MEFRRGGAWWEPGRGMRGIQGLSSVTGRRQDQAGRDAAHDAAGEYQVPGCRAQGRVSGSPVLEQTDLRHGAMRAVMLLLLSLSLEKSG